MEDLSAEDTELFEKVSKMLYKHIESHRKRGHSFYCRTVLPEDIYRKIKGKTQELSFYINDNYLCEYGLQIVDYDLYDSPPIYLRVEIDRAKYTIMKLHKTAKELEILTQTVKELQEMVTEIYYAPGMPGYISAKESFENKN